MTQSMEKPSSARKSVIGIDTEVYVEHEYGEHSWQSELYKLLCHHQTEVILLFLLVLDIIIVMVEILLDVEYPTCDKINQRDLIRSCCPVHEDDQDHNRFLSESSHHSFCEHGYEESTTYGCDDHNDTIHNVHLALFGLSVAILCVFEVELLLKVFILKKEFFCHKLLVFDLAVVTTSIVLDIVLHALGTSHGDLAALLAVVRVWRFVRVIHGVLEVDKEHMEEKYKEREHELEKELHKLNEKLKLANASSEIK